MGVFPSKPALHHTEMDLADISRIATVGGSGGTGDNTVIRVIREIFKKGPLNRIYFLLLDLSRWYLVK